MLGVLAPRTPIRLGQISPRKPIATLLLLLAFLTSGPISRAQPPADYLTYHRQIRHAEEALAQRDYPLALARFDSVLCWPGYVFLRDCQVATQLAWYVGDTAKAYAWLRRGMEQRWTLPAIRKIRLLRPLRTGPQWRSVRAEYDSLRARYEHRLHPQLRAQVLTMARQDQQLALRHILTFGRRARERFLTRRFIPHSQRQLARLAQLLQADGYPGEKLTGNRGGMARILSHHNSISTAYTQQDTLYPRLQPALLEALRRGELAPADYAIIEEWYVVIKSERRQAAYGYLRPLTVADVASADARRQRLGLRSVALRNQLVDVQAETGMDLRLDGVFWVKGKIPIVAHE